LVVNGVDVSAVTGRVIARLRVSPEVQAELRQQAALFAMNLLRDFKPSTSPDAADPRLQTERYLATSLRWHLRDYLRDLQSPVPIPPRDRRLAQAYRQMIVTEGFTPLSDAARRLGTTPKRLEAALGATEHVTSLDLGAGVSRDGDSIPLIDRLAADDLSPEQQLIATLDAQDELIRRSLANDARTSPVIEAQPTAGDRRRQAAKLLYGLLDQLPAGDAELLRLAYALPRRELGSLRSCRAYGCRQTGGHEHLSPDLVRWTMSEPNTIRRRLQRALEDLGELLGGRDAPRFLREVSRTVGSDRL
jgi:hypothetical protein